MVLDFALHMIPSSHLAGASFGSSCPWGTEVCDICLRGRKHDDGESGVPFPSGAQDDQGSTEERTSSR